MGEEATGVPGGGDSPWQEGGGETRTLIETRDDPGGGLNAGEIVRVIEEAFAV